MYNDDMMSEKREELFVKYSIIIPVHNNEQTLPRTMESVLSQNKPFEEIILVENASDDQSLALCYQYQKEQANVTVLTNKEAGSARARNRGIKEAQGEYLFFLDADDTIDPTLLEMLDTYVSKFAQEQRVFDLYEVNFKHYFSATKFQINPFILTSGAYEGDDYLRRTLKAFHEESKFMIWRFLYKKTFFIEGERFFDERLSLLEDVAFMQKYLTTGVTIYVIGHTPLVNYLFHENSLTQTTEAGYLQAIEHAYRTLEHPSKLQDEYFAELVVKTTSRRSFNTFAQQVLNKNKTTTRLQYEKIRAESFFRRMKRRWKRTL